jgi:hypothetical protein
MISKGSRKVKGNGDSILRNLNNVAPDRGLELPLFFLLLLSFLSLDEDSFLSCRLAVGAASSPVVFSFSSSSLVELLRDGRSRLSGRVPSLLRARLRVVGSTLESRSARLRVVGSTLESCLRPADESRLTSRSRLRAAASTLDALGCLRVVVGSTLDSRRRPARLVVSTLVPRIRLEGSALEARRRLEGSTLDSRLLRLGPTMDSRCCLDLPVLESCCCLDRPVLESRSLRPALWRSTGRERSLG